MADPLVVSPKVVLSADDLRWTAVRGSGPGGQNVNKVSSKVELRFDVVKSMALDSDTKERLVALAGHKMDKDGVLIIVCQESRDQRKNLETARERLKALVEAALIRPKKRRKVRVPQGVIERRLETKRLGAAKKRQRSGPFE